MTADMYGLPSVLVNNYMVYALCAATGRQAHEGSDEEPFASQFTGCSGLRAKQQKTEGKAMG